MAQNQMAQHDVFLSYARADSARAELVRRKLEALGLDVFFDADEIDSGAEFPAVIDAAVKGARCVLALWSRAALERRWVRIESRIGLDQSKLVAAMLDGTPPEALPAEFYNVNFQSLADWQGADDHPGWRRVLRAIGKRVGKPLAPEIGPESAPEIAPPQAKGAIKPWMIGAGLAVLGGAIVLTLGRGDDTPAPAPPPARVEQEAPTPARMEQTAAIDVTGLWRGAYWGPYEARVDFEMDLISAGASFRGGAREPNPFSPAGGMTLTSIIAGETRGDGAIAFRKTYDGSSGISHSVDYEGRVENGAIVGTWRVGDTSGAFRMTRD